MKAAWILAILSFALSPVMILGQSQSLTDRLQEAVGLARSPERIETPEACTIQSASLNSIIFGRIDTSSCNTGSPNFLYVDFYRLTLTSGTHMRLVYTSAALSPLFFTVQRDSDGAVLTFGSGNSPQTLDFFAPFTGLFDIGLTSLSSFKTGDYTLSIQSVTGTGNCTIDAATQCLQNGRFKVVVTWTAPGQAGTGTAVPMTSDSGYFWFFNSANVELVIKVLDGRGVNGKFWVFYGALSNVQYTIRVTDTQTAITKFYTNPQGQLASVADTGAF